MATTPTQDSRTAPHVSDRRVAAVLNEDAGQHAVERVWTRSSAEPVAAPRVDGVRSIDYRR